MPIREFGYFEPTRVCYECRLQLEQQVDEESLLEQKVWEATDE